MDLRRRELMRAPGLDHGHRRGRRTGALLSIACDQRRGVDADETRQVRRASNHGGPTLANRSVPARP